MVKVHILSHSCGWACILWQLGIVNNGQPSHTSHYQPLIHPPRPSLRLQTSSQSRHITCMLEFLNHHCVAPIFWMLVFGMCTICDYPWWMFLAMQCFLWQKSSSRAEKILWVGCGQCLFLTCCSILRANNIVAKLPLFHSSWNWRKKRIEWWMFIHFYCWNWILNGFYRWCSALS